MGSSIAAYTSLLPTDYSPIWRSSTQTLYSIKNLFGNIMALPQLQPSSSLLELAAVIAKPNSTSSPVPLLYLNCLRQRFVPSP